MSGGQIIGAPEVIRRVIGNQAVGLVPTMGALHEGHMSIIRRSAVENPVTVVSIFVNPMQFNDPADLSHYPRAIDQDAERAFAAGATLIYAPSDSTVYPSGFSSQVTVAGVSDRWEGAARPGHFAGVATVVSILLNTIRPARSYFGEKDYQQLAVIRRMHRDLHLPGEIVGCPTIRDRDGLALSSRNARLTERERFAAAAVPEALFAIRERVAAGEIEVEELLPTGRAIIAAEPLLHMEYLAIVDGTTLDPVSRVHPNARALIAVTAGATRLIDNLALIEQPTPHH
jgi:pantoate--beta-alanine ligase